MAQTTVGHDLCVKLVDNLPKRLDRTSVRKTGSDPEYDEAASTEWRGEASTEWRGEGTRREMSIAGQ